ncbi:MAG TPA: TonB family protein [Pyrinomonadaceae bacterium]
MKCNYCGHELTPFTKFCTKCGNPAPQPSQAGYTPPPAAPQPPPASWGAGAQSAPRQQPRRKSRAGKILLIVFTVLAVLGVGAGALAYFGFKALKGSIKSSEAYSVAERELRESRRAADVLGEIKETGFPIGTYKQEADGTGQAAFTLSVVGTKASGRYFVTMHREGGTWHVTHGLLQIDGREESIDIMEEKGAGPTGPTGPEINAPPPPPPPPGGTGGKTISGGVLNGKAISKPQPPYPAIAKAAKAQGTVTVQVVVDEEGKVISASAVGGHPLLQAAAVQAARQARFSPTKLSGKPVKVSGVVTYNFVLE